MYVKKNVQMTKTTMEKRHTGNSSHIIKILELSTWIFK